MKLLALSLHWLLAIALLCVIKATKLTWKPRWQSYVSRPQGLCDLFPTNWNMRFQLQSGSSCIGWEKSQWLRTTKTKKKQNLSCLMKSGRGRQEEGCACCSSLQASLRVRWEKLQRIWISLMGTSSPSGGCELPVGWRGDELSQAVALNQEEHWAKTSQIKPKWHKQK